MTQILFVGNHRQLEDAWQPLLRDQDYRIILAENVQAAIGKLAEEPFDLIALQLPGPDPEDLEPLKALKATHPSLAILVLDDHGTVDRAVDCMSYGAHDYIPKPFKPERLLLGLQRAGEKKKLQEKNKLLQEEFIRTLFDLNTERKRLETIINCLADGLMVTDLDLDIVLHNQALGHMLGITEAGPEKANAETLIDDKAFLAILRKIVAGSTPPAGYFTRELKIGHKYLRAICAPALAVRRNVFWAVAGTVTVFQDISTFKQLDQMKSDFVNMVAHELRSPLVSIRQLHTVLLEGMAGPLGQKQEEFLNRGKKKIDTLLDLINDLLNVARLEAGEYQQRRSSTDIGQLVLETTKLLEPRAKELGIELGVVCQDLEPVEADPKDIELILNNLLTNAVNYSPEGGKVTITARILSGHLEIRVTDTGVGISEEELPKIFDKFYRIKHPKTRQVAGTGLGLAIVKGIIQTYRGTIDVESTLNKGTTFRVLLPTRAPSENR